jgi:hypothetical protein
MNATPETTMNYLLPKSLSLQFSKVEIVEDNARTHGQRPPSTTKKSTNAIHQRKECRWMSSPVPRKSVVASPSMPYRKRRLPSNVLASLPSLVAPTPIHHRQRTIPIDDELDSDSDPDNEETKIHKASELLSEYLRIAQSLCTTEDDATVSTATATTMTMSSLSTMDSAASNANKSVQSLTTNVRKPERRKSRDNMWQELYGQ